MVTVTWLPGAWRPALVTASWTTRYPQSSTEAGSARAFPVTDQDTSVPAPRTRSSRASMSTSRGCGVASDALAGSRSTPSTTRSSVSAVRASRAISANASCPGSGRPGMAYGAVPARTAIIETWWATTSCSSRAIDAGSGASMSRWLRTLTCWAAAAWVATDCRRDRSISPAPQAATTARASASVASQGVSLGANDCAANSTTSSVARKAQIAARLLSRTGQATSATSQPTMAGTGQDSRPKYTKTALAPSISPIEGAGKRRITATGAVARMDSTSTGVPESTPGAEPLMNSVAITRMTAITIGPVGRRKSAASALITRSTTALGHEVREAVAWPAAG